MDALRAILMILGVFLHSAYIYAPGTWRVNDPVRSGFFQGMTEFIHFFRMPCFFILSGIFAQMLLGKYGRRKFLNSRVRRLAVPLIASALLLNSLEGYFMHAFPRDGNGNVAAFLASVSFRAFWMEGEWLGHLWFLVNVILYSLGAAAAGWLLSRLPIGRHGAGRIPGLPPCLYRGGWFVLLLPGAHLAVLAGAHYFPFLYHRWGGAISLHEQLWYIPYFLFGMLLFLDKSLREEFQRFRAWHLPALAGAFPFLRALKPHGESPWGESATLYVQILMVWIFASLLFAGFRRLLNRPSPILAYLSDASYTIYLFHHGCVVALGFFLMDFDWNIYLKFCLIVSATLAWTLAIHHFGVLRVKALRFLFNGK